MVGMGSISRPGAWAFPDCLELGVPGSGVLTWEESKSHLALYAVTSAPLILGTTRNPPNSVLNRVLTFIFAGR